MPASPASSACSARSRQRAGRGSRAQRGEALRAARLGALAAADRLQPTRATSSHDFVAFAGMTPGAYASAYRGLSNYLPITLPPLIADFCKTSHRGTAHIFAALWGDFDMPAVNWLAVVAAAISMFVIGGVWYSAAVRQALAAGRRPQRRRSSRPATCR